MAKTITISDDLEKRIKTDLVRYELEYWITESRCPWEYLPEIKVVLELLELLGEDITSYIDDYEEALEEEIDEVKEYERDLKVNVHLR